MPRNICLAFGRFGSLFLLTSSVSADGVVCLVILSGCYSSSSLAIPMASAAWANHADRALRPLPLSPSRLLKLTRMGVCRTTAPLYARRYTRCRNCSGWAPMRRRLTLVLGAVPWEVKPLQLQIQEPEEGHLFGFPFLRGHIEQRPVLIAITGVGKTNAAMISTLFISQLKPTRLLYTGTAAR